MDKRPADRANGLTADDLRFRVTEELSAEGLFELGVYYQNSAKAEKAVECYQKAIDAAPGLIEAHYNIGVIRYEQKAWDAAIRHFDKALELKPDFIDAAFNLAAAFKEAGRYRQAALAYQKVVQLDATLSEAFHYQSICCLRIGQVPQAIHALQHAVRLAPDNPLYWFNLAEANLIAKVMDSAIDCYRRAIALKPDWDSAHYNLAVALRMEQRLDEAIDHLKQALKANPDFSAAHALLFRLAQHTCNWPLASESDQALTPLTEKELSGGLKCAESPLTSIRRKADVRWNLKVAQSWSSHIARHAAAIAPQPVFEHLRQAVQRIRVGYLSNDFRDHAVAHQIRGMLEKHDRRNFEIFGYATNPDDGTRYRRRLFNACDHSREIHHLSDLAAAKQIHDDGIRILVDMSGHSRNNRLGIAALRPAPIQASYLGFLGTTGAQFIDYVFADAVVLPKEHAAFYSEKVVYLPHCYQANDDQIPMAQRNYERSQFDLPNEGFVYCSFNQPYKIDQLTFGLWLKILKQVDGSVLWLVERSPLARRNLCRAAEMARVDPKRLVFTGFMPLEDNLARLQLADLVLDTRIYNGGATTSNALWAGVPVLTLPGDHWVSRMSASALVALGLPELIANNLEDYGRKAVELASDPARLTALRQRLRRRRSTAPLFDTRRFTHHIEKAYNHMWQRHLDGLKPASFEVVGHMNRKGGKCLDDAYFI